MSKGMGADLRASARAVLLRITILAAILGMGFAGCATTSEMKAIEKERLLAAAGFHMKLADTPEKLEHLKTLAQRRLTPHQRDDGKVYYIYADATSCKCLYAGDEKAYQRYMELAEQRKIADEERRAAEMNEEAVRESQAMDWQLWGPMEDYW